jgi:hypothetical protein
VKYFGCQFRDLFEVVLVDSESGRETPFEPIEAEGRQKSIQSSWCLPGACYPDPCSPCCSSLLVVLSSSRFFSSAISPLVCATIEGNLLT